LLNRVHRIGLSRHSAQLRIARLYSGLPGIWRLPGVHGLDLHAGLSRIDGLALHAGLSGVDGLTLHAGLSGVDGLTLDSGLARVHGLALDSRLHRVRLRLERGLSLQCLSGLQRI
jgi:hypothetical protein